MNERRCQWCHGTGDAPIEEISCDGVSALVHTEHRAELERYCADAAAAKWRFLGGIGLSVVLGIAAQFLAIAAFRNAAALVAAFAAAIAGLTLLKFPFSTPETVAILGVRRSIRVARSCAMVILAVAVGLAIYGVRL